MKAIITVITVITGSVILTGCQSTSSSFTPEQKELISSLCTQGDGSGGGISQLTFEQSIMDCGGYDIFTEDMLIGKTFNFNISKKTKRSMTVYENGVASYTKANKGTTENIEWALDDRGNLKLSFEDGYKWDWVLLSEAGNLFAIKSFGYSSDPADRDIISMIVESEIEEMTQE